MAGETRKYVCSFSHAHSLADFRSDLWIGGSKSYGNQTATGIGTGTYR